LDLVLGIDGGGTGCRAALASLSGRIVGRGSSGPANVWTDAEGARRNILYAVEQAFTAAGCDKALIASTDAVLGLAGANVGNSGARLMAMLPFRRSVVETDAVLALEGALGPHDGAIAALGTGSVYLGRVAGRLRRIGGWGFVIGDLGSGARIGRDLLQEALLVNDGVHRGSALIDVVLERFAGDPRQVVEFTAAAQPADYGGFAPLVFEHAEGGDAVARMLVARAASDVGESLDAFGLEPPQRLCLLGGLAGRYAPLLAGRHQALLHPPLQDALGGAVAMALRIFGKTEASHA
jgi:glucosamine kinase